MAFHPRYMTQGIANGSYRYDYVEWNRTSRSVAAKHIGKDTRDQPTPRSRSSSTRRSASCPRSAG